MLVRVTTGYISKRIRTFCATGGSLEALESMKLVTTTAAIAFFVAACSASSPEPAGSGSSDIHGGDACAPFD